MSYMVREVVPKAAPRQTAMRIAIVAPEFPPAIGGAENYAFEVAKGLIERGFEVTVFTVAHDEGEASIPGVRVIPSIRRSFYLDREIIRKYASQFDIWHVMNAAWSWIALETGPVVASVYGNDFLSPNPVIGYDLKRRFRLPKGSRADFWLARWRTPRVMRRAFRSVRHVVACSQYTENAFLGLFDSCHGKTSVGYVGVADEFFAASRCRNRDNRGWQFLTVCRLHETSKNVDKVLRGISLLRGKHEFHYTVIGDGELRTPLINLARELKLEKHVEFLGFIPRERLKEYYAASDLFIMTTDANRHTVEGFGIAYLEASACGTPVLAARMGGAMEAVEEGVNGFFVDQPSPEAIAGAIHRFVSGDAQFLPRDCRQFAQRFRWSRVVDHVANVYARLREQANVRI